MKYSSACCVSKGLIAGKKTLHRGQLLPGSTSEEELQNQESYYHVTCLSRKLSEYVCVYHVHVLKIILLYILIDNVLKWKLSLVAAATEEELLV